MTVKVGASLPLVGAVHLYSFREEATIAPRRLAHHMASTEFGKNCTVNKSDCLGVFH